MSMQGIASYVVILPTTLDTYMHDIVITNATSHTILIVIMNK